MLTYSHQGCLSHEAEIKPLWLYIQSVIIAKKAYISHEAAMKPCGCIKLRCEVKDKLSHAAAQSLVEL